MKKLIMILAFVVLLLPVIVSSQTIIKDDTRIELLENTDICIYDFDNMIDRCRSLYRICDLGGTLKEQDIAIKYTRNALISPKDQIPGLFPQIDIKPNDLEPKIGEDCRVVEINAEKNPFLNVDNVPFYKNVPFNEFVWWNSSFPFKYRINHSCISCSSPVEFMYILNDTSGIDLGDGKQYIWANFTSRPTRADDISLYFADSSIYQAVNETDPDNPFAIPMFVDQGNGTDFKTPSQDLTAWYTFNGTYLDRSVAGNVLTNHGTDFTTGKIGKGADFELGDVDYVDVATPSGFTWIRGFTYTLWFNFATPTEAYLADQRNGVDVFYLLTSDPGTRCPIFWIQTNLGNNEISCTVNVTQGWHHGAFVFRNNGMSTFIDGVNVSSGTRTGTLNTGTGTTLTIGARYTHSASFDGLMDEIRVYNRSLTAEQILALYENSVGGLNFAPTGKFEREDKNTSILGVPIEISDFSFASSSFVPGFVVDFNSSVNETIGIMNSMNLDKLTAGGTNTVTVRIILDSDQIILTEDLRTLTGTSDIGSVGTSPILVNVSVGEHNITYEFLRTGSGSINVTNIDFSLFKAISNAGFPIRGQIIPVVYNHSALDFTSAFNWTIPKLVNSSTFYLVKQTVTKNTAGDSELSYFFRDITFNHDSPFWARLLSGSAQIGSVSGTFIDVEEDGELNYSIMSKQTDAGDTVEVNGSLIDLDMIDSNNNTIMNFQNSSSLTNLTEDLTLTAGTHLLVTNDILNVEGDSVFLSMTTTFMSTSGSQTPTYFINSTQLPESDCRSDKERYLSSNTDIGNAFIYFICSNATVNTTYTFNLYVIVEIGETLVQMDESFNGFIVTSFDITEGNLPPIPNSITNPLNNSNISGSDIITWLTFTDPNGDAVTYNVTLNNIDGTHNTTIEDGITGLSANVNWNSFPNATYFLVVEGCDPTDLCSSSNITITIIRIPIPLEPSQIFCLNENELFVRESSRTTTNGVIVIENIEELFFCENGCSNWTISTFGNPGCIESDFWLSMVITVVVVILVLVIRGSVK